MAWDTGFQIKKFRPDALKEALELRGDLTDAESRYHLGRLMRYNLGFTWLLISGQDMLLPFQEIILNAWFEKDYSLVIAGRGVGKSYLLSIFILLYAILNENTKIVLVANNFRRVKDIFSQMEKFLNYKKATLLRQCFELKTANKIKMGKQNDQYLLNCDNGSVVKGLPLGCIALNSRILTNTGSVKLQEMCEGEKAVEVGRVSFSRGQSNLISQGVATGLNTVTKITTHRGYELCATPDHPIAFLNSSCEIDYKPVEEFTENDYVVLDSNPALDDSYSVVTSPERSYFLGLMLGDGCFTNKYFLRYTTVDAELIDSVRGITGYVWKRWDKTHYQESGVAVVNEFLDYWKLGLCHTKGKYIPERIFNSSKECRRRCLRGLFDTDGHVQVSTLKGGFSITVGFTNTSHQLIQDIQLLLLDFGIISHSKFRYRNNCNKAGERLWCYSIVISGEAAKLFAERVGFALARKQDALTSGIASQAAARRSYKNTPFVKEAFLAHILDNKIKMPEDCCPNKLKRKTSLSDSFIRNVLNVFRERGAPLIKVESLMASGLFFEKIRTTENQEVETGDLHVEGINTYTANRFLVHNCGENLRGERANVLIIDEGLLVSEHIQKTILEPFLTARSNAGERVKIEAQEDALVKAGMLKEEDKTVFQNNKLIITSSASYQFEYLFEGLYLKYIANIQDGKKERSVKDPTYFVCRASYEVVPQGSFLAEEVIQAARETNPNDPVFRREYCAEFVDGGGSYFDIKKLHECTIADGSFPTTQVAGAKGCEYILAIDPSYGDSKSSDFFAMGVYMLHPEDRRITQIHSYGKAGTDIKEHYEYLIYLLKSFNIVMLVIDASGTEFIQGFVESQTCKNSNINLGFLSQNFEKSGDEYQREIDNAKSELNGQSRHFVYAQPFNGDSIRAMNEYLQGGISAKRVWFASKISAHEHTYRSVILNFSLPYPFRDEDDNPYSLVNFLDDQDDWIEQTKRQLALIEVKSTNLGTLQYDIPSHLKKSKNAKRARRDNYTCLLMAYTASKHYYNIRFTETVNTHLEIPTVMF